MICTIGSLVQETSKRYRWLISTSLYTIACLTASVLLGALLSRLGQVVHQIGCSASICTLVSPIGSALVGCAAVAYAFSDIGLFRLPRPTIRDAVPVTWWRWWRPYGAALAYGAALGLGVMTRIQFGAFYVLILWCVLKGDPVYGAMLMGTYGAARALVMFPASWSVYGRHDTNHQASLSHILAYYRPAKVIAAVALMLFGAHLIASMLF